MSARRQPRRVRVRSKRLDQIDESKLALALWLMVQPQLQAVDQAPTPSREDADVAVGEQPFEEAA